MSNNPYFQQVGQAPSFFAGTPITPSQMMNLSGVPGMNGPLGMIVQMLLQPMIQQLSASHGFIPLQFQQTQGAYDHLTANMVFRERMRTMQIGSDQDQETAYRTLRGIAHLNNTPWNDSTRSAARNMAKQAATWLPHLAMANPDFLDQASGVRGSSTVMHQFMSMGLRYARDPITGLTGPDGETSGAIASRVFKNFYGKDLSLEEVASRTRGLSAGRMGQLFEELQRRGLMGAGITEQDRERVRAETEREIEASPNAASLRGQADEINNKKLTNITADRYTSRLKNMAGAVQAMREIFGDQGRKGNMVELINSLDALTQGGLATMSGAKLESTVRNIHMLVKNSGMTMDGMLQLMAGGARVADKLGLDREYVVGASQGAASFSAAFAQTGGGNLPGYGSLSREKVIQLDQQLRLNAAASFQANLLSSVVSLEKGGFIKSGTAAARLAKEIKDGTIKGPLSLEEYYRVLKESGVTRDMANQSLHNTEANREYGLEYDVQDTVRNFQPKEFSAMLKNIAAPAATAALDKKLKAALGDSGLAALQRGLGNIINMTPEQQQSANSRLEASIDMMLAEMTPDQLKALGNTDEERRNALRPVAFTFLGNVTHHTKHLGGTRAALQMMNPETLRQGRQFRSEQRIKANLAKALAPFGLSEISRRAAQAVINSDKDTDIGKLFAQMFGGIPATPGMDKEKLNSLQKELGELFEQGIEFDVNTGEIAPKGGTKITFKEAVERYRKDPTKENERILTAHTNRLIPGLNKAFSRAGVETPDKQPLDDGSKDPKNKDKEVKENGGVETKNSTTTIASSVKLEGEPFVNLSDKTLKNLKEVLKEASSKNKDSGKDEPIEIVLKDVEIKIKDERSTMSAVAVVRTRGSVRPSRG